MKPLRSNAQIIMKKVSVYGKRQTRERREQKKNAVQVGAQPVPSPTSVETERSYGRKKSRVWEWSESKGPKGESDKN